MKFLKSMLTAVRRIGPVTTATKKGIARLAVAILPSEDALGHRTLYNSDGSVAFNDDGKHTA